MHMNFLESLLMLIGRICITTFFFWAIVRRMKHWHETVTFMKSKNIPQVSLVLPIIMGLKALGAVLVLMGIYTRVGALLLVIISVPSMIRFHDFWSYRGLEQTHEQTLFMKDMAIIGGLLFILAAGGGNFGLGS
jgi:putative oxidoreductase